MIMTKPVGVEALTPAHLTLRVEVAEPGAQLRIAKGCRQEMVSRNASDAREVQDKSRSGNALLTKPDLSLADARVQVWKQHPGVQCEVTGRRGVPGGEDDDDL
jgi:hypothetical protein